MKRGRKKIVKDVFCHADKVYDPTMSYDRNSEVSTLLFLDNAS